MLVRYGIPIPNYYGDEVFFRNVYFECERCPTFQEFKDAIKANLEKDDALIGKEENAMSDLHKILETLECPIEEWPTVNDGWLVHTNTFVMTPEFGRQPLSVTRIQPYKI